ncbi:biofilm surface layer hydrophobin BslB [Bacillus changyiensis]|uniref:biofilm surface layer hydrophobin BslB n=1 Tax=Bacillus changyiensis TaxID=3004103 RepID=UPI0022E50790|nr:biofilm surface layer hydrophobin BslB [Bacillus changyiensis]MDA1476828.1 hypothetical protein [Bacillus changyiensis]
MLKRKLIRKISIGLVASAALFSMLLPTQFASARETARETHTKMHTKCFHFRWPIFCPPKHRHPHWPHPGNPCKPGKPDNPNKPGNPGNPTKQPTLEAKTVQSVIEWTTSDIEITYRPNISIGDSYVVFHFPYRFHASTRDTLNGKTLDSTQILDDGQTVRVPVNALSSSEFKLVMVRKTLPNAGTHKITAELQKNGKNFNHTETNLLIAPRK